MRYMLDDFHLYIAPQEKSWVDKRYIKLMLFKAGISSIMMAVIATPIVQWYTLQLNSFYQQERVLGEKEEQNFFEISKDDGELDEENTNF